MADEKTQKILRKVRQLLALATSSNVNEAAAAAAAAQRLMCEYQLSEAEIDLTAGGREPVAVGVEDYEHQARTQPWKNTILNALCRANGAKCWRHRLVNNGCTMKIAGTVPAITTIRYLHAYLCAEVERLCKAHRPSDIKGTAWANSFRLGAAYALHERILAEAQQVRSEARAAGKDAALALIDSDRARVQALIPGGLVKGRKPRVGHGDALRAGHEAGKSIRLGGHAGLGAGSAAYLN